MFSALYSCFLRCIILPFVAVFTSSGFWSIFNRYQKNQGKMLFEPEINGQLKSLQKVVKHASENTEYYGTKFSEAGYSDKKLTFDNFRDLPRLTKQDIENNFPDQITSRIKQHLPWRYVSTSGTIERLTVMNDFHKRDYVRAAQFLGLYFPSGYLPGWKLLEIPPDICTDVCGAVDVVEPGILQFLLEHIKAGDLHKPEQRSDLNGMIERQLIQRKTVLPSFPAGGTNQENAVLQSYVDNINLHQPDVIKALPAYLYILAGFLSRHNLRLNHPPVGIMPMGGGITRIMQNYIEAGFSSSVSQEYGCAEMGTIASEQVGKKGQQTYQALFYVEIVSEGKGVDVGQTGKLLITDLSNFAMPMIRYDIGDVARLLERNEASGNVKSFEILGRVSDCIRLESNKVLTPDSITDFLLAKEEIFLFQLEITRTGACRLDIVPEEGGEPDLKLISDGLAEFMQHNFKIKIRKVKSVQPERSGKYRFVKNASELHQVNF